MSETKWIDRFLSKPSSKVLVRVDDKFLCSSFNCYGLKSVIKNFDKAYELIIKGLTTEKSSKDNPTYYSASASCSDSNSITFNATDQTNDEDKSSIEKSAEDLYGLIHSRFIQKARGLQLVFNKYKNGDFPDCPRYYCKAKLLPFSEEEGLGQDLKWYCPVCNDVYCLDRIYENEEDFHNYSDIDGGYFGNSWIYLFRQKYGSRISPKEPSKVYVPRIFGFRIAHPKDSDSSSDSGPGSSD